jgi:hypothetical protein
LAAKIDKGFFMADGEWTCYRRNYFQISTAFNMAATMAGQESSGMMEFNGNEQRVMIEHNGAIVPVDRFKVCINSRVAAGDKIIGLVQHTSKRDKGPQIIPTPKTIRAGGTLAQTQLHQLLGSAQLNAITNQSVISFERIQFKSATANNGKRRAAQQHYVIEITLFAEVAGQLCPVATCHSAPLIVRGRSPGHYNDSPNSAMFGMMSGGGSSSGQMYHQEPMMYENMMYLPPSIGAQTQRMQQLMSPGGVFSPMQQLGLSMPSEPSSGNMGFEPSPLNMGQSIAMQQPTHVAPSSYQSFQLPESMSPFKQELHQDDDRYGFHTIMNQELDLLGGFNDVGGFAAAK